MHSRCRLLVQVTKPLKMFHDGAILALVAPGRKVALFGWVYICLNYHFP